MCCLVIRVECWVRFCLGDVIGLEFNKLGFGWGGLVFFEGGEKLVIEKDFWDWVWNVFIGIVKEVEMRFVERVKSFEVSLEEVEVGFW